MKLHEVTNQERSILSVMGKQEDPFNDSFWCNGNNLTSLEGAPSHVSGSFWCSDNKLTSLEGAPSHVGRDFLCEDNKLTSLNGAPSHVGGDFACYSNKLTSLKDINKQIKFIGGSFYAANNAITSHILGLFLIDGLKRAHFDNMECAEIINKHLGKGKRGMFDAQQELIEAGFPEMAKL